MIPPAGTPERLRYTYWYLPSPNFAYFRIHYSESNIMMLNIMALVFGRMPERSPFFIKPLLKTIAKKAEQGISDRDDFVNHSFLRPSTETESGIY